MKKRPIRRPDDLRWHVYPLASDDLHFDCSAFVFIDTNALLSELRAFEAALPPDTAPAHRTPTYAEMFGIATRIGAAFPGPEPESPEVLKSTLALLPLSETALLARRLRQLNRAIEIASNAWGRDHEPSRTFAVPPVWRLRWESLLGGRLLLAYVASVKVDEI